MGNNLCCVPTTDIQRLKPAGFDLQSIESAEKIRTRPMAKSITPFNTADI